MRLPRLTEVCGTCVLDVRSIYLKDISGLMCCTFADDDEPPLLTAEGLVTILRRTPDATDEFLMKGSCDVLQKTASEAKKQELGELLLAAAVSTQNLQAINLTLRHCVPELTPKMGRLLWTSREIPLNLTGLIWDDFPQHLSVLLQTALDSHCQECLASWDSALPALGAIARTDLLESRNLSLLYGHSSESRNQYEPAMFELLSDMAEKPGIAHLIEALHVEFVSGIPAPVQFVRALSQLLLSSRGSLADLEIGHLILEDARSADEFSASLRRLSKLQSLTFLFVQMPAAGLAQLLPADAAVLPQLGALAITSRRKDNTTAALGPFLAGRAAGLRYLKLVKFGLPAVEADQFVAALRQLRQLESLKLDKCDLPVSAASQLLANASSAFPSLRSLGLRLDPSTDAAANRQDIAELSQALAALSPCPLQVLRMSPCGLANEDLLRLFDALENCRNLGEFNMHSHMWPHEQLQHCCPSEGDAPVAESCCMCSCGWQR